METYNIHRISEMKIIYIDALSFNIGNMFNSKILLAGKYCLFFYSLL